MLSSTSKGISDVSARKKLFSEPKAGRCATAMYTLPAMTVCSHGRCLLGVVLARPIFAPMNALTNFPGGREGNRTIHALLKPMYQFESEPPSAKRPKRERSSVKER
ncbi:MAG: hypothetical protein CO113_16755 [Elusimicrobia bacterium CG_4_9_14_3_um_filter_62_55]|nr:MAG: hypothetical protein CO113_16755 [Elusimicrobia bacterium CG_4_9_14_3_um_filter_62_55]